MGIARIVITNPAIIIMRKTTSAAAEVMGMTMSAVEAMEMVMSAVADTSTMATTNAAARIKTDYRFL